MEAKVHNIQVQEDLYMAMQNKQICQKDLSLLLKKNVKVLLQLTAKANPYSRAHSILENFSNETKLYRMSNKPLGNTTDRVDYS